MSGCGTQGQALPSLDPRIVLRAESHVSKQIELVGSEAGGGVAGESIVGFPLGKGGDQVPYARIGYRCVARLAHIPIGRVSIDEADKRRPPRARLVGFQEPGARVRT
ncbi:MAG: hypothetical protein C4521_13630 [Actinobacteria bacterium]|nr:MAG: hypothetical protein C4521_13630 [Actinomycetota bacterium]